jgi:hypothetical protein
MPDVDYYPNYLALAMVVCHEYKNEKEMMWYAKKATTLLRSSDTSIADDSRFVLNRRAIQRNQAESPTGR